MKKILLLTLLSMLTIVGMHTVKADMGPKPSVTITIIGMGDIPYTFDLLSEDVNGEFIDPVNDFYDVGHYLGEEYPNELFTFKDSDDLSVWSLYGYPMPYIRQLSSDSTSQVYREGYHPPREFKVLLYLEDGTTIISELVSRNYFDSTMTWDVTDVDKTSSSEGLGVISGNIHVGPYEELTGWDRLDVHSIPRLLIRILVTIAIEVGVLFAFRYKKKRTYSIVTITNAITQIGLTYLVARALLFNGALSALMILFVGELIVVTVESLTYIFMFKERNPGWALFYAIMANISSIIIGYLLVPFI